MAKRKTPTREPTSTRPARTAKPRKKRVGTKASTPVEIAIPIGGPTSVLERFRSRKAPAISGVAEHLTALPILRLSEARDFVRLSPHLDRHWTPELCFVDVPVHGEKRDLVHLINEDIAMRFLSGNRVKRYRLALGSKPYSVWFFASVPTTNLENSWNASMLAACERAQSTWVQVSSRKAEGHEAYKIDLTKDPDAFPEPQWPAIELSTLVETAFLGRLIETENHPALARLIGAKQVLK